MVFDEEWGRGGFLWPGLNIPIVKSGTIQAISKRDHAQQEELQAEIIRQRDEWDRRRRMKPAEGAVVRGLNIDNSKQDHGVTNTENYEDFDSSETHQNLAENKQLHVVEFQNVCGPLPIIVASPHRGAREDPKSEDEIPDTKLDWDDVKAAQGMKRSIWASVKRTIW
ncbi:UNVERIFIED_CONTAM: hypothetical protein FKN15_028938 [Acipenser sinensis]